VAQSLNDYTVNGTLPCSNFLWQLSQRLPSFVLSHRDTKYLGNVGDIGFQTAAGQHVVVANLFADRAPMTTGAVGIDAIDEIAVERGLQHEIIGHGSRIRFANCIVLVHTFDPNHYRHTFSRPPHQKILKIRRGVEPSVDTPTCCYTLIQNVSKLAEHYSVAPWDLLLSKPT
jgi:hypothetical protein